MVLQEQREGLSSFRHHLCLYCQPSQCLFLRLLLPRRREGDGSLGLLVETAERSRGRHDVGIAAKASRLRWTDGLLGHYAKNLPSNALVQAQSLFNFNL